MKAPPIGNGETCAVQSVCPLEKEEQNLHGQYHNMVQIRTVNSFFFGFICHCMFVAALESASSVGSSRLGKGLPCTFNSRNVPSRITPTANQMVIGLI